MQQSSGAYGHPGAPRFEPPPSSTNTNASRNWMIDDEELHHQQQQPSSRTNNPPPSMPGTFPPGAFAPRMYQPGPTIGGLGGPRMQGAEGLTAFSPSNAIFRQQQMMAASQPSFHSMAMAGAYASAQQANPSYPMGPSRAGAFGQPFLSQQQQWVCMPQRFARVAPPRPPHDGNHPEMLMALPHAQQMPSQQPQKRARRPPPRGDTFPRVGGSSMSTAAGKSKRSAADTDDPDWQEDPDDDDDDYNPKASSTSSRRTVATYSTGAGGPRTRGRPRKNRGAERLLGGPEESGFPARQSWSSPATTPKTGGAVGGGGDAASRRSGGSGSRKRRLSADYVDWEFEEPNTSDEDDEAVVVDDEEDDAEDRSPLRQVELDEEEEDDLWLSSSNTSSAADNSTTMRRRLRNQTKKRREFADREPKKGNQPASSDLDLDDDLDADEGVSVASKRKTEVCVLNCPNTGTLRTTPPPGVDRVVTHKDFIYDLASDKYVCPKPGPSNVANGKMLQESEQVGGIESGGCPTEIPASLTADILGTETALGDENTAVSEAHAETAEQRTQRKYLIKWTGRSHMHNSLLTHDEVVAMQIGGIKKVSNYIKKQEELRQKKLYMSEDEIEQMVIALELQRQLDADALIPERIVTHNYIQEDDPVILQSMTQAPENDSAAQQRVLVYLIKWTSRPYDQSTWERSTSMEKQQHEVWAALVTEYHERESLIYGRVSADLPLNQHDLSETSFEPYVTTPPYLGVKNLFGTTQNGADAPKAKLSLRDYQLTGMNWIVSRMKKNYSVLLADEMGLGKTAQTVSVIGHMLYEEKVAGPFLIVVPQSTMDNWLAEFRQWLPLCNVVLYHGNPMAREIVRKEEMKIVQAARMSKLAANGFVEPRRSKLSSLSMAYLKQIISKRTRYRCDVIITTFSILQCPDDLAHLRSISWYLMVIDEAHQLKNRESKRFKELCMFRPRYKLLLSGTPLHNNLEELWSLLHFMNPQIYAALPQFQFKYSEIEKTNSTGELKARQLNLLQKELSQIVLRRVKKDVLKGLPNKVEWILRVELSPKQSQFCRDVVVKNYEALSKSTGGSKVSLQNICVELKKICNHPFLLNCPEEREEFQRELLWSSGKMCLLDKLLTRLKEKDHRVLIFSQMVRMLNLLSTFLTLRGYKHQRLDGTMSRDVRRKAMDHFNADGSDDFCFLLSTKAGGLGINLTSADTVIIYDSDWNPQNDLQAEARAHRIGQTKTVQIYRIVTKDSVEEEILERAKTKMVLDALVVQGLNVRTTSGLNGTNPDGSDMHGSAFTSSKPSTAFSREELTRILKFGATKLWDKKREAEESETASSTAAPEIDLDRVLAEAEESQPKSDQADATSLDGGVNNGRAADLLSSFSNVSDFRYEAPKPPAAPPAASWDKLVPLEDRLEFENSKSAAEVASGKSSSTTGRSRRQTNVLVTAGKRRRDAVGGNASARSQKSRRRGRANSEEELPSPRTKRGTKRLARPSSDLSSSEKEAGQNYEDEHVDYSEVSSSNSEEGGEDSITLKRGGKRRTILRRKGGVLGERGTSGSKSGSRRVFKAKAEPDTGELSQKDCIRLYRSMMKFGDVEGSRSQEILEDAKLTKFEFLAVVQAARQLFNDDAAPIELSNGLSPKSTASNGQKLQERILGMNALHQLACEQNGEELSTGKPWLLGSRLMKLELPENFSNDHQSCQVDDLGRQQDSQLLKGIYIHGFASWQKITADPDLSGGQSVSTEKKVKSDKIKLRAVKLLNGLVEYFEKRENNPKEEEGQKDEKTQEHPPSPSTSTVLQDVDNSGTSNNSGILPNTCVEPETQVAPLIQANPIPRKRRESLTENKLNDLPECFLGLSQPISESEAAKYALESTEGLPAEAEAG